MYCRECGSENTEGSLFCRNCATPLREETDAPARPAPPPVSVAADRGPEVAAWDSGDDEIAELLRHAVDAETVGDLAGAVEAAEEAVRVDPSHAGARSSLAGYYERAGRTPEAIAQYEAALQLDPSSKLDRLRLSRLAPGHPALRRSASGASDRKSLLLAAGVAAAVFVLVTGGGLAGYFGWYAPRQAMRTEVALASTDLNGPLVASARAALAAGDLASAERDLTAALEQDRGNAEAKALLQEVWRQQAGLPADPALVRGGLGGLVFSSGSESAASDAVLGAEDAMAAGRVAGSPTAGLPALPPLGDIPPAVPGMAPPTLPPISTGIPAATGPVPENVLASQVTGGQRQAYTDAGTGPGGFLTGLPGSTSTPTTPWGASGSVPNGGGLTRGGPSRGPGPVQYSPGPSAPPAAGGADTGGSAAAPGTIRPNPGGGSSIRPRTDGASGGNPGFTVTRSGDGTPRGSAQSDPERLANEAAALQARAARASSPEERIRALQGARERWQQSGMPHAGAQIQQIDKQLRIVGGGQ